MTAMAARTMGYRVRVMDPEPRCPASFVADETIVGRWDDVDAARGWQGRGCRDAGD
jgi:5-(carboxyamino)imidazole ribonucleotide synthase